MEPINNSKFTIPNQIAEIVPEKEELKSTFATNNITILVMAIFVLLSLGVVVFLYYQNQQLKSILASYQTPVTSPTFTTTTDPTANWKSYSFDNYPLSLSYPADFELKITKDMKSEPSPILTLTNTSGVLTIKPEQPGLGFENPNLVITESTITVSNVQLQKNKIFDKSNNSTSFEIMVPYPKQKEYLILVRYDFKDGKYNPNLDKVFDQILSTFKFSEQTSSGFKKYADNKIGINFEYPSTWTYKLGDNNINTGNVVFDTGLLNVKNGTNYMFELSLENESNFNTWTKYETTSFMGTETLGTHVFSKYIVADMYYSLNYVLDEKNKLFRFLIYPYDQNQYPEGVKSDVNQILSTFKFTN